ncbi:hypothetical protein DIPPA_23490 [Diplonema papillatum]|nr:hypothetical protein DIPPA_23490 [Diplonema papillatum]
MRRATSCKYISTTPTVSVMETKVGENLRKQAAEYSTNKLDIPAARVPRCVVEPCRSPLQAEDDANTDDDELLFGFE